MTSVKSGVTLQNNEKTGVDVKDDEGTKEIKMATSKTGNTIKKENHTLEKTPSSSIIDDTNIREEKMSPSSIKTPSYNSKLSSIDNSVSANVNIATAGVTTAVTTLKGSASGIAVSTAMSNEKKLASMSTTMPATTGLAARGSTAPIMSKTISDPKIDTSTTHIKKERTESYGSKSICTTTSAAKIPKQSQQQSHSNTHTQQQHRYFVPSRQNQEEAVFKMVQNIFKLLETRGPLTMAQLEYNLPILILGSSPSISIAPQMVNSTASKINPVVSRDPPTGDSSRDDSNASKIPNTEPKSSSIITSLCEEKLIPGNMVPNIVELLVTLGLIQLQTNVNDVSPSKGATLSLSASAETDSSHIAQQKEEQAASAKNQFRKQPRFAVHFGKPKQFLVTPTNILSEISKAQFEIQLSRQRQDLLKEALIMADQEAAERVKHIVLQHPQVVDDPVYVTALRNLQIDGMLMAGASGTTTSNNSNASPSSTFRDGSGKPKSGVGGSGKTIGGGKRRQSGSTPARRKRQRSKKDLLVGSGDVVSGSGERLIASSTSIGVGSAQTIGGSLPTERSKEVLSTVAAPLANASLSTQPVASVASASVNYFKNA